MQLEPSDLEWIGLRFLDPVGRVFKHGGQYFRAIYPGKADFIRSLIQGPLFADLVERRLIPPTEITDIQIAGYDLVIRTATSPFRTRLSQLPPPFIRQAALNWIEINQRLADEGLALIDGHIANFALFGTDACWIDIGSIQPGLLRPSAVSEFARSLLFPLLVMESSPHLRRLSRLAMEQGGLDSTEVRALLGEAPHSGENDIMRVLRWMQQRLESLELPPLTTSWGGYISADALARSLAPSGGQDPRLQVFDDLTAQAAPTKAVDLGSAGGRFSVRLAARGIPCLSVDIDETALTTLHGFARSAGLPVTVHLQSVLTLAPQPGVDFVSAMALTHHLALSQMTGLEQIARLLSAQTEHALVTEFMPLGLGAEQCAPNPLPAGYTLEAFMTALSRWFRHVQVFRPERPGCVPRHMIFCQERL